MKTHAEILALLAPWAENVNAVSKAIDGLSEYFSVENPLYESVWAMQSDYTKAVAEQVGDAFETLDWFQHENRMGASGYEASPSAHHAMREIRTLDDLAQFIVDARQ